MSRELGRQFGRALESHKLGLSAAERDADERVLQIRRGAQAAVTQTEVVTQTSERLLNDVETQLEENDVIYRRLRSEREMHPTEFSIPRGLMYLLFSLLLLAGDVTVLGGVLAQLLGLPLRDENTGMAVTEIVKNLPRAWDVFPHVIVLTLAVLLLGFFPKVYFESRTDRTTRSFSWAIKLLLLVSTLAVCLTAWARIYVIEGPDGSPANSSIFTIASVLLGIALPYVSCIYFMRGVDKLGHRIDLFRAWARLAPLNRKASALRARRLIDDSELVTRRAELARVNSPEFITSERAAAAAEFSQGYAEASSSLLEGRTPGAVFSALRTVAVSRALR